MKKFKIILLITLFISSNIKSNDFDKSLATIGMVTSAGIAAYLLKSAKINYDIYAGKLQCKLHDGNDPQNLHKNVHYRGMVLVLFFIIPTATYGLTSYKLFTKIQ